MKRLFPVLCAAMLLVSSMNVSAAFHNVCSVSKQLKDDRDVKDFNGVAAGGPIHVIITLGNTESCRFEGDAEAIETLITEVKGNVLITRPKNSWTSWEHKYEGKKITAYVTAKNISSLTMSGSGSMALVGKVNSGTLSATLSGSGSIKAAADVDHINGVISGSGTLSLTGSANDAKVVISGSGNFEGKSLSVNNLSTTVSGSGTVNIKADQRIKAVISGSGNVNYSGNAEVEKTVIGSGRVRKI